MAPRPHAGGGVHGQFGRWRAPRGTHVVTTRWLRAAIGSCCAARGRKPLPPHSVDLGRLINFQVEQDLFPPPAGAVCNHRLPLVQAPTASELACYVPLCCARTRCCSVSTHQPSSAIELRSVDHISHIARVRELGIAVKLWAKAAQATHRMTRALLANVVVRACVKRSAARRKHSRTMTSHIGWKRCSLMFNGASKCSECLVEARSLMPRLVATQHLTLGTQEVCGASRRHLSSYTFTLMTIYFLQALRDLCHCMCLSFTSGHVQLDSVLVRMCPWRAILLSLHVHSFAWIIGRCSWITGGFSKLSSMPRGAARECVL